MARKTIKITWKGGSQTLLETFDDGDNWTEAVRPTSYYTWSTPQTCKVEIEEEA